MKRLVVFTLLIVASSPLMGQVKYFVSTDSLVYHYGDSIHVTITAVNTGSTPDTLWLCDCFVEYIIDNFNLFEHRSCSWAITDYEIPPHDSLRWTYLPPYPVNRDTLTVGKHAVIGEIVHELSDTLWITVSSVSAVEGRGNGPQSYVLEDNYPDPFNPSTRINYQLPVNSYVTLKIYDVLGREVATLVNKPEIAGTYSVVFDAADLPSGLYFDRFQAGTFSETKKLLLLK